MKLLGFSKKTIIIGIAVIAVIIIVAVVASGKPKVEYETYAVDRGEVVEVISVTGSIAPSSKIKLQPEVSGRVIGVLAKEGDEVKKGDVLLQLNSADIETQLMAQRAAVASAQARLAEYEAGATEQELLLAERAVETAQTRLDSSITAKADADQALVNAQNNLANTRAKAETQNELRLTTFLSDLEDASNTSSDAVNRLTDPLFDTVGFLTFDTTSAQAETNAVQTRGSAEYALPYIASAWANAQAAPTPENIKAQYLSIVPYLNDVKANMDAVVEVLNYTIGIDNTTLSTYKLNASTAQSSVSAVAQALSNDYNNLDLQIRLNETEIIGAQIAVSGAESAVNTAASAVRTNQNMLSEAQAALQLKRTGTREEILAAQRAAVSAENARLAGLQNEWNKRRIVAPVDGIVTLVSAEVGESLMPNQTVMLMNAVGNLEVTANISEIDIAQLEIGDPVTITLDAFADDLVWKGTVVAVQPAETVVDNVISYETTIRFEQEDERLRSGMTANLDIEIDRRDNVLRVPIRAVKQNGHPYVEVLDAGDVTRQVEVGVGLETDDYAEIMDGLQEGDEVVVYQREL